MASERGKNPIFSKVLSSQDIVEQFLASASLAFAPGLFEVLQISAPPTIAWFKSLPSGDNKRWAIYLLVLEKPFCRPQIYIGSGTDSKPGAINALCNTTLTTTFLASSREL
jgi:hypothetical protein